MPLFTYLSDSELEVGMKAIEDRDIIELLDDVRALDPNFYIVPRTFTTVKGFIFKRVESRVIYNVFIRTTATEVQELNIGKDKVSVISYMYGFINGIKSIVLI